MTILYIKKHAFEKLANIEQELTRYDEHILRQFNYVRYARRAEENKSDKYTVIEEKLLAQFYAIKQKNTSLAYVYNRYLTAYLIAHFDIENGRCNLPDSVKVLYPNELQRILDQLDSFELDFFDFDKDPFVKDLAILNHRLIPVGAEFVELNSGIPRSFLFRGGVKQLLYGAWFCTFYTHGFRPFFALHAHILSLDDFNPDGWHNTYKRLAELLKCNEKMKGWMSSSWFLDPQLEKISPHLVYLRKVPQENGAAIFFVEHDPEGKTGSLAKSATRRRLFQQGRYRPAIYMRVWPHHAMLRWYQQNCDK